jgi:fused signal recognition particle receptor
MAFFSKGLDKLKGALRKTAQVLNTDVRTLFIPGRQIDEEFLGEIGDRLMGTDMGVRNVDRIVDAIRDRWRLGKIRNADEAAGVMRDEILRMLTAPADGNGAAAAGATAPAAAGTAAAPDGQERELHFAPSGPTVILVAGINGAGKTTSIAKLAWLLKNEMGKKVMVAASDTFRAGAVHQLSIWAERIGVEIIRHRQGADPAAVAYDACEAAKARNFDVLIVDTAGRLHTQDHLMRELTKIRDVVAKRIDGAPHEVLLVLDATSGQNAVLQAQNFGKAIHVSGIILAKLDGTARGGVVLPIKQQLNIPVKFVGLGETPQDIETFDPRRFVDALFGETS